jgi:O-antigen/teichoic acid export membrane protein
MRIKAEEPHTIADAAGLTPVAHGRSRRYLAGVLTSYAVTGLTVGVSLWLTPFALRFLDREEYALFVFGNDLLTWLVLLDLGVTAGLSAQAAQLTGRPDPDALNRLASRTFFTQIALALVMLGAGAVLALAAPKLFNLRPELRGEATLVLLLLALGAAFNFATQTFSSLLVAPLLLLLPAAVGARLFVAARGGYAAAFAAMAATGACGLALLWRFTFDEGMRAQAAALLGGSVSRAARVGAPRRRVGAE